MESMNVQRFHILLRILLLGNPEGEDTESLGFQSHGQPCFGLSKGLVKAERFSSPGFLEESAEVLKFQCESGALEVNYFSVAGIYLHNKRGKKSPSSQSVILVRIEPVEVLSTEQ